MDFSEALRRLRDTDRPSIITRSSWDPPGTYVAYQTGYPDGIAINANTSRATGKVEGTVCFFQPYMMMGTHDGSFVPWTPTMGDCLAGDWEAYDLLEAVPDGSPGVLAPAEHGSKCANPNCTTCRGDICGE